MYVYIYIWSKLGTGSCHDFMGWVDPIVPAVFKALLDCLVVGAGPVGLLLASELLLGSKDFCFCKSKTP